MTSYCQILANDNEEENKELDVGALETDAAFNSGVFGAPGNCFTFDGDNITYRNYSGSRELLRRYYDSRFFDAKFDGVSLKNPYSGKVDVDAFYFFSPNFKFRADSSYKSSNSVKNDFTYINTKPKEFTLGLFTGNSYDAFSGGFTNQIDYFKFTSCASFVSGYDLILSKSEQDSPLANSSGRMPSSDFSTTNFFTKCEIKGADTKISISIAALKNLKNIPVNSRLQNKEYIKNPGDLQNIINLGFLTPLGSQTNFSGNIFLRNLNYRKNKFDDSTYTTQVNEGSYVFKEDSYVYGGTGRITFLEDPAYPLVLETSYQRDVVSVSYYEYKPEFKYETEVLQFSAKQRVEFENSFLEGECAYLILRPVFTSTNPNNVNLTGFDWKFTYETKLLGSLFLNMDVHNKNGLPSSEEMFNFSDSKKLNLIDLRMISNNGCEIKTFIRNTSYVLSLSIFADKFSGYYENRNWEFDKPDYNLADSYYCAGTQFSIKLRSDDFTFDYHLYSALSDKPETINRFDFLISEFSAGYILPYDITLKCEGVYNECRLFAKENNHIKTVDNKYFILDVKANLNLYKNYDVFLLIKNITDKSYESAYGVPGQGRRIIAGIFANI